jgi:colanic acid biosynthesis protein WcaH
MNLSKDLFNTIVTHTPLISIDLIVENGAGEVLLGKRLNRPAQGYWFVPGGRVLKNETLDVAFVRLTQQELGVSLFRSDAVFHGVYEHLYEDSFIAADVSTHYVVLAYRLKLSQLNDLPKQQHGDYAWFSEDELLTDGLVHENTKAYFSSAMRDARCEMREI